MKDTEGGRGRRASMILAALAGVMLTAGGAAAQVYGDDYESEFIYDDSSLYEAYDAGFDTFNETDDWFYDYYEYDDDYLTTGYGYGDDYNYYGDWLDDDTSDVGSDDAGDEGWLDW